MKLRPLIKSNAFHGHWQSMVKILIDNKLMSEVVIDLSFLLALT